MKYPETAKRLTEAMHDKRIKAAELARRAGVTKGAISQYVNGSTKVGNINAGKIAEVLDVSPMWLMGFDVSKHKIIVPDPDDEQNHKLNRILIEITKMNDDDLDRVHDFIMYINYDNEKKEG